MARPTSVTPDEQKAGGVSVSRERVVFYGGGDMCYGLGLDQIETLTIPVFESITINDAIEYCEIYKYFQDGARAKKWTDEDYACYAEKSKKLMGLAKRYFNSLADSDIIKEYDTIELYYLSAFWELFNSNKLYERISKDSFGNLLECEHIPLANILEHKSIVGKYGEQLKGYILKDFSCVGLLIRHYEQNDTDNKNIYLPDELTGCEIVDLFDNYLESNQVNANHAKAIFHMKHTTRFPVDDGLRLKAKRRYDKEFEDAKAYGFSTQYGAAVSISKELTTERVASFNGGTIHIAYSYQWLSETLDYPSILNNFIYIFEYADYQQMRCNLVSIKKLGGIMERVFKPDSRQYYPDYLGFLHINGLADIQMKAYCSFLSEKGIRFENVIIWFFTKYLQKEFDCPEIRLSLPSADSAMLQKCVDICTAIEIAVKQFVSYAETGEIDFEKLMISSGSPTYDQIPSLVDKKYIYGNGNEYERIDFLLFSDKCPLYFVSKVNEGVEKCNCFIDLLLQKKVKTADYRDEYLNYINKLADLGLIVISKSGEIELGNQIKLSVLRELHFHDVISRWHYPDSAQAVFKEWIERGLLIEGSTLLSRPEADYLSYLLNREKFCNGLDLRNKYAHGVGQLITDEREHEQNYIKLLKVMMILVIKINEDFCLQYALKESKSQ